MERFKAKIEELVNPEDLVPILYRDRDLTPDEIDEKVLVIGYQIALRKLVQQACANDTKAIDLLFKRADSHFSKHRKAQAEDDSKPSPSYKPRPQ